MPNTQQAPPTLERRIRELLDPKLPYRSSSANLALEIVSVLEVPMFEVATALVLLEQSKTYKYERRGATITGVKKGKEFCEFSPGEDGKPRSVYGKVLVELRKAAVNGVCRLKKPASYLSGRIYGLSTAEAEEALYRLHEAAIISVFPSSSGEAEILIGDDTEPIDYEVQELIGSGPVEDIPCGNIYVLLERLLAGCETAQEELKALQTQVEDSAERAKKQAGLLAESEAERERMRKESDELRRRLYPSNRVRKELRKAGLLE